MEGFTMEEIREIQQAFKEHVQSEENGFDMIDSMGLAFSSDYAKRNTLRDLSKKVANINNLLPLLQK